MKPNRRWLPDGRGPNSPDYYSRRPKSSPKYGPFDSPPSSYKDVGPTPNIDVLSPRQVQRDLEPVVIVPMDRDHLLYPLDRNRTRSLRLRSLIERKPKTPRKIHREPSAESDCFHRHGTPCTNPLSVETSMTKKLSSDELKDVEMEGSVDGYDADVDDIEDVEVDAAKQESKSKAPAPTASNDSDRSNAVRNRLLEKLGIKETSVADIRFQDIKFTIRPVPYDLLALGMSNFLIEEGIDIDQNDNDGLKLANVELGIWSVVAIDDMPLYEVMGITPAKPPADPLNPPFALRLQAVTAFRPFIRGLDATIPLLLASAYHKNFQKDDDQENPT